MLSETKIRDTQAEGYAAGMADAHWSALPYRWSEAPDLVRAWSAGYAQARTDRARRMTRGQDIPDPTE